MEEDLLPGSSGSVTERVHELVEPLVQPLALELVDVTHHGKLLRVTLDKEGGIDMESLTRATRLVSRALDEHDPIASGYTLEVSSPGLERPLRTPAHFERAVGKKVAIKLRPGVDGDRRAAGVLVSADDDAIVVRTDEAERRLGYDDITKARTVFEWEADRKVPER